MNKNILEYKVKENNIDKLREITNQINGFGAVLDVLDLYTMMDEKSYNCYPKSGIVKVGGAFATYVNLIHLLAAPNVQLAVFLFDKSYNTCADDCNIRVVGFYDGKKQLSRFVNFSYGDREGGTFLHPERVSPIRNLEDFRISPCSVKIRYSLSGVEKIQTIHFPPSVK